ncbi:MAG: AraC family transcriptional regulator [Ruminococcus sp.]|jgi:AraC-like DNA-binding protein|nr:AraC family transcriptional regulator [Ruminococcus sp.]
MIEKFMYEKIIIDDMLPAQVNIISGSNLNYMPHHWHRSIEMNYLIESDTHVYLNGKEYILGDDSLILINSGDIHMIRPASPRYIKVVSLIISYDFLKERFPEIDYCQFSLDYCFEKEAELKRLLKNLYELFSEKSDPFYIWRGNALIYQIIYLLLRYYCMKKNNPAQFQKTEKYKERFKIIIEYINERYKEDLTLEAVAQFYGLSREHLSRNFKKYMGMTFRDYLDSIRLNYAYNALLNTDFSVLEIALNSGFSDERAFTRCFKKNYGITPAQYRKNIKNL